MFNRRGISNRVARKYAAGIIRLVAESRQQNPSILEQPVRTNWKPPGRQARLRLEALKLWRSEKAQELGLHVGVVFPAYLLEGLAMSPPADLESFGNLPDMRQWRAREFGAELLQLLQNQDSQGAPADTP
jgi:ribonuclease D